jgi:hypothetical protein
VALTRRGLLLCAGALALPARADAPPPELQQGLPSARLQGQGRLRFFGLHVYDIRLWTAAAFAPERWAEAPLALEIQYARTLYGQQIAERSLDEMKRQGEMGSDDAQRWLAEMARLFPDVKEGDRITGTHQPGRGATFFVNGRPRGEVLDANFARRFFGIWLAPQTSEPALRERLFGRQP